MTRTLHIVTIIAVLIVTALVADSWLAARRSNAQLSATLAVQNKAIEQDSTQEKQRSTQLAAALSIIAAEKRRVQTALQAAANIPNIMPQLPLPIAIDMPTITQQPKPTANPLPATISIPQPDLKPLYDDLQDCRTCSLERDATQKDLADEQAKVKALTTERDQAIAAAHGGAFWSRLKRATKWFAIGALAGAAATAATHR